MTKADELDPERLCITVLAEVDDAPGAGAAAGSPEAPKQGRRQLTLGWAAPGEGGLRQNGCDGGRWT
jgi:hypothetical protein